MGIVLGRVRRLLGCLRLGPPPPARRAGGGSEGRRRRALILRVAEEMHSCSAHIRDALPSQLAVAGRLLSACRHDEAAGRACGQTCGRSSKKLSGELGDRIAASLVLATRPLPLPSFPFVGLFRGRRES